MDPKLPKIIVNSCSRSSALIHRSELCSGSILVSPVTAIIFYSTFANKNRVLALENSTKFATIDRGLLIIWWNSRMSTRHIWRHYEDFQISILLSPQAIIFQKWITNYHPRSTTHQSQYRLIVATQQVQCREPLPYPLQSRVPEITGQLITAASRILLSRSLPTPIPARQPPP